MEKTAPELISFLTKASKFQELWRQPSVVEQMITRYYRFMQLKATNTTNMLLVPTMDIEMIWQTHLLRPQMYQRDCLRLFHRVIDHSLLTNEIEQFLKEQAFRDTCQLYEERFGESYCPLPATEKDAQKPPKYEHRIFGSLKCLIPVYSYWDQTHVTFTNKPSAMKYENPFSFTAADAILDGNWLDLCQRFMTEMRLKGSNRGYGYHNTNQIDLRPESLRRLMKSYERFLYMATKYPPSEGYAFIHPTYAVSFYFCSSHSKGIVSCLD